MNAGAFARQFGIIAHGPLDTHRSKNWRKQAIKQLMRETGVAPVMTGNRTVAYRTPRGQVMCAKHRYTGFNQAVEALREIHMEQDNRRKPIRPYPCDWCGGWHVTSMPR